MQNLQDHIHKLKIAKKLILVEGPKDKKALQRLGVKNIITLKKPLFAIVEEISAKTKECIILTDLDKKGKELYSKLSKDLKKHGVKIDNTFRNFLLKETKLKQIEGLTSYIKKFSQRNNSH